MVKSVLVLLLCLLMVVPLSAQDVDKPKSKSPKLTIGLEQDVLPYILKGFIATVWVGKDYARGRFSYAHATTPKFTHAKDIKTDLVRAFGVSYEFFFKEKFEGFWVGPGVGYWTNYITTATNDQAKNESVIFSIGGGYNYVFLKRLYVTPWLALHSRVSGNDKLLIANTAYQPAIFTPEVSIKLGIKF